MNFLSMFKTKLATTLLALALSLFAGSALGMESKSADQQKLENQLKEVAKKAMPALIRCIKAKVAHDGFLAAQRQAAAASQSSSTSNSSAAKAESTTEANSSMTRATESATATPMSNDTKVENLSTNVTQPTGITTTHAVPVTSGEYFGEHKMSRAYPQMLGAKRLQGRYDKLFLLLYDLLQTLPLEIIYIIVEYDNYGLYMCLQTLTGHNSPIRYLIPASNDEFTSFSSEDFSSTEDKSGTIKNWNLTSGTCTHTSNTYEIQNCLCRLSDGRIALGQGPLSELYLSDANLTFSPSGRPIGGRTFDSETVTAIIQRPNGHIVVGRRDGTIEIFHPITRNCLKSIPAREEKATQGFYANEIQCLTNLSDNLIATGSKNNTITIWDLTSYECLKSMVLQNYSKYGVQCLTKLHNDLIAAGSSCGTIEIFDITTGNRIQTLKGHDGIVTQIIQPNKNIIVSSSCDGTIKTWDFVTGKCLQTLTDHGGPVRCLMVHPSGGFISGSEDTTIKFWR